MILHDAIYYTQRALSQLECARKAADGKVARVHARLFDLYLDRARTIVERESIAGLPDNVVMLRVAC